MKAMTFIIKTTDACNARCVYCSAYEEKGLTSRLSVDLFEALCRSIVEHCEQTEQLFSCRFTWHGGEPLLRSSRFYREVMKLQEKWLVKNGIPLTNQMQSNLLALTPKKLTTIKALLSLGSEEPGSIGTSYDPIPGYRVTREGDYERRWSKSIDLLEKESIRWGMISVAHRESVDRVEDVYEAISTKFQGHSVRFNPLYFEGRGRSEAIRQLIPSPAQWGNFLVQLHRLWERDGKREAYNPLKEWDAMHHNGKMQLTCESSGRCAETHLGLTAEGDICGCGRCIDRGTEPYGHIGRDSLSDIMGSARRARAKNRSALLELTECQGCHWWSYCHGGCMADSLMNYDAIFRKTSWCEGIRIYLETIYGEPASNHSLHQTYSHPKEFI